MIMQPSRTGVPPPSDTQAVVSLPARLDLVWGERVRTSRTGPLLIAAGRAGSSKAPFGWASCSPGGIG